MKKVTKEMLQAFLDSKNYKKSNTEVYFNHFANCLPNKYIYLFGNCIAKLTDDGLYISNAGWFSNTTKERLNALPGVSIQRKNYKWFLNGSEWDGNWVKIG